jgi:hypothetical protein
VCRTGLLSTSLRHPDTIRALDLTTLAKLCQFLNCQPGDFITYIPKTIHDPTSGLSPEMLAAQRRIAELERRLSDALEADVRPAP